MPGRLTTHVLDTMHGRPASQLIIQCWRLSITPEGETERTLLKTIETGPDGRAPEPLLQAAELLRGSYELIFAVGNYFKAQGVESGNPPFLDQVPVRFGISDPQAHYHIPLLVTPWSYSTYRGS
ncbi:MAG TPA: hydroxyisourate hydrolase [Ktedonobacteraceae bacterium]|nr:hydroxyisourate hydrolase [Ktedonobacteraceae bacterium]